MRPPEHRSNSLAVASLLIGVAGLPFGGLLGVGAIAAMALGGVALAKAQQDPQHHRGRELAWAGIVAGLTSLAAALPLIATVDALRTQGELGRFFREAPPPDSVTPTERQFFQELAPPPPPPPPPPTIAPVQRGSAGIKGGVPGGVVGGLPGAPPPPQQAVRVGGTIKEPTKIHHVSPVYPDIAKQARVQGIVILECMISPQGKVTDVKVLRGIPLLDQAAIDAVKQWVYTPTLLNGVPVPVIMTVTVNFKLS